MASFKALMLARADGGVQPSWLQLDDSDLMEGDVTVRVTHSTINYKDGLVLMGKLPGLRLPLIPGIDFSGTVLASSHPEFAPGDDVILNGWGCGERHHGGYAERARVKGDWLVKRPDAFTNAEAMRVIAATSPSSRPCRTGSPRSAKKRSHSASVGPSRIAAKYQWRQEQRGCIRQETGPAWSN